MIMLVVEFDIAPDSQAAFEVAMTKLAAESLGKEKGTLLYQLAKADDQPGTYRLTELYVDQAALDAHMASDWFREAGLALRPLMGARPVIHRHTAINNSFAQKGA